MTPLQKVVPIIVSKFVSVEQIEAMCYVLKLEDKTSTILFYGNVSLLGEFFLRKENFV